ncbi:MAG TPA: hypothetical protein PKK12_07080 [Candidatus Aminicenantes bacterium]|nr:hypothetical protein [Candidatus Aminicenantes bacterium]
MENLILEHAFDAKRNRHYLNGHLVVMHCHHYASLFTQLALDARELVDGTRILQESAEDSFRCMLVEYFTRHQIHGVAERIDIGCKLYGAFGLGLLEVPSNESEGGEAVVRHSHLDEGWIRKWGTRQEAVNFITCGYVAALFAAAYDRPPKSFTVTETQSIVRGADRSVFQARTRQE